MFEQLQVTNDGLALLTELLNGHQIQFTKIKLGNGGERPADIASLKDLVSVKQTLDVARASILTASSVNVGANLLGTSVTEAFNWTEVGIFAKDLTNNTPEILFSYQYATTPVPIPEGGTVAEMLLDFVIQVGNSENVNITIDSSLVLSTKEDLDKLHSTINSETQEKINQAVNPVNQSLQNHIGNKNNPHSVTKEQVGLGSVQNYAIASETEARAGSSNEKYMTPLRTKNLIESASIITSGNINLVIGGAQPSPISGKTIIWIDTSD